MLKRIILTTIATTIALMLSAQSYFDKGMAAIVNGDYKTAMENLQQEVRCNQSNAITHYFIGLLYEENEDYGQALRAFEFAIKYGSSNKTLLSNAYKCIAGVYVTLGKSDESLADYALAIKTNPKNADAFDDRGNLYFMLQDYNKSDKDYQKAIKLDPEDPLLGYSRNAEMLKDYKTALKYYTQAISLRPDNATAYRFRADIYAAQKDLYAFTI